MGDDGVPALPSSDEIIQYDRLTHSSSLKHTAGTQLQQNAMLEELQNLTKSQELLLQGLQQLLNALTENRPTCPLDASIHTNIKARGIDIENGNGGVDEQQQRQQQEQKRVRDVLAKLHWLLPGLTDEVQELKDLRGWLFAGGAMLASVTYTAALNPPGGAWTDSDKEHRAGESVLKSIDSVRYWIFYVSNVGAFAGSVGLMILMLSRKTATSPVLKLLRVLLAICILTFCFAFAAGSNVGPSLWPNLVWVLVYIGVVLAALYITSRRAGHSP